MHATSAEQLTEAVERLPRTDVLQAAARRDFCPPGVYEIASMRRSEPIARMVVAADDAPDRARARAITYLAERWDKLPQSFRANTLRLLPGYEFLEHVRIRDLASADVALAALGHQSHPSVDDINHVFELLAARPLLAFREMGFVDVAVHAAGVLDDAQRSELVRHLVRLAGRVPAETIKRLREPGTPNYAAYTVDELADEARRTGDPTATRLLIKRPEVRLAHLEGLDLTQAGVLPYLHGLALEFHEPERDAFIDFAADLGAKIPAEAITAYRGDRAALAVRVIRNQYRMFEAHSRIKEYLAAGWWTDAIAAELPPDVVLHSSELASYTTRALLDATGADVSALRNVERFVDAASTFGDLLDMVARLFTRAS